MSELYPDYNDEDMPGMAERADFEYGATDAERDRMNQDKFCPITIGEAQQALIDCFGDHLRDLSWDEVPRLIREMDPNYEPGVYPWTEVEDYMAELWERAGITFKDKS